MAESSPDEVVDGSAILLSNGIMGIVQPAVDRLDSQVHAARASQYTLNMHIRELAQCKLMIFAFEIFEMNG
ncbi:unnamed protein product [Brugia timori]|uniref:Biogenesis of lysosome-related organelles complex 1 subunit 7 n=1 Tax=Brugia timori TaxID=42155 RepID=A0A0R3QG51_9BILA|nr:unnamed protein product [Brugia timori]